MYEKEAKEFAEWLDDFLVDRGYPENPLNENEYQEILKENEKWISKT